MGHQARKKGCRSCPDGQGKKGGNAGAQRTPRRVAAGQQLVDSSPDTWSNVMAACWFSPASQSVRGTSTYAVRSCVREAGSRHWSKEESVCLRRRLRRPAGRTAQGARCRRCPGPGHHARNCFKGGPAVKHVPAARHPACMPAAIPSLWYAPVTQCRPLAGPE